MVRFQHPVYLVALLLVPVLAVLAVWAIRQLQARLKKAGDPRLVGNQMQGLASLRKGLRYSLLLTALAAAVVGWANLQQAKGARQSKRKGVDVIVALDVSKSMLAQDLQPDRLTRAKQLISRLADKLPDDRIGLVIFAGRAYQQVPLTFDHSAVKMMLQSVTPDAVPTQGTVLSEAIDLANESFSGKERKYKALVLISDGEDHDDKAISEVKKAVQGGAIVHTVGVGSQQGAMLIDPETKSTKMDENGEPVITKLNQAELQSIAQEGHGTYTLLRNANSAADKLSGEIGGMETKGMGAVTFAEYASYFQWFLGLALLLLVAERLVPSLKMKTA